MSYRPLANNFGRAIWRLDGARETTRVARRDSSVSRAHPLPRLNKALDRKPGVWTCEIIRPPSSTKGLTRPSPRREQYTVSKSQYR